MEGECNQGMMPPPTGGGFCLFLLDLNENLGVGLSSGFCESPATGLDTSSCSLSRDDPTVYFGLKHGQFGEWFGASSYSNFLCTGGRNLLSVYVFHQQRVARARISGHCFLLSQV